MAPEGWDEFEKKKDLPISLLHTFLYIYFPLGIYQYFWTKNLSKEASWLTRLIIIDPCFSRNWEYLSGFNGSLYTCYH